MKIYYIEQSWYDEDAGSRYEWAVPDGFFLTRANAVARCAEMNLETEDEVAAAKNQNRGVGMARIIANTERLNQGHERLVALCRILDLSFYEVVEVEVKP